MDRQFEIAIEFQETKFESSKLNKIPRFEYMSVCIYIYTYAYTYTNTYYSSFIMEQSESLKSTTADCEFLPINLHFYFILTKNDHAEVWWRLSEIIDMKLLFYYYFPTVAEACFLSSSEGTFNPQGNQTRSTDADDSYLSGCFQRCTCPCWHLLFCFTE